MSAIHQTPQAEADLYDLWAYVAGDNPSAADGLLDAIDAKLSLLAEHPGTGRARDELAPGLRSFPAGEYLIFYRPLKDGIEVVRVLHAARDLPSLFGCAAQGQ